MKRTLTVKKTAATRKITTSAATITQLLKELKLSPEEFLTTRNGTLALATEKLKDGDTITIHPVFSGG